MGILSLAEDKHHSNPDSNTDGRKGGVKFCSQPWAPFNSPWKPLSRRPRTVPGLYQAVKDMGRPIKLNSSAFTSPDVRASKWRPTSHRVFWHLPTGSPP